MPIRLLLVRHGHVPAIEPPTFRGRAEIPLSDEGRRQAALTAARIGSRWSVASVWTSPLGRCIETGAAIGEACGAQPRVAAELTDLDYGDWTLRTHEEMRATAPALFARWRSRPEEVRFPGGETLQDLAARAAEALRRLDQASGEGAHVFVTHDSVVRAILLQLLGLPLAAYHCFQPSPCGLTEAAIEEGGAKHLQRFNETAHLEGVV